MPMNTSGFRASRRAPSSRRILRSLGKCVPPGLHSHGLHFLSADANEAGLRMQFPETFDQGGAKLIPRSLSGDQGNGGRVMSHGGSRPLNG
jgi:hypothetical protein